jgi:arylsulfatase
METCDDEFVAAAQDFIRRQEKAGKPWFVWLNKTHMHCFTHTTPKSKGQAGRWQSDYHDTMIDHDKNVGQMLDFLDEMGLAEDTFVQYSTDNGPHRNTCPMPAPRHSAVRRTPTGRERSRVPLIVRWPGRIEAGSISNEIVRHHDWMPTFLAMAGAPDVIDKLKKGYKAIGRTYKNHIDGYNFLPYLTGEEKKGPRQLFFYFSDDGDVLEVRMDNWKILFMEQRTPGKLDVWRDPFVRLRGPKMYNLRTDPFEFADVTSNSYNDIIFKYTLLIYAVQDLAGKFAETFKEFPAVQKPNSFTIDDAMAKMSEAAAGTS